MLGESVPYQNAILSEEQVNALEKHLEKLEKRGEEVDLNEIPYPVSKTIKPSIFKDDKMVQTSETIRIVFDTVEQLKEAIDKSKKAGFNKKNSATIVNNKYDAKIAELKAQQKPEAKQESKPETKPTLSAKEQEILSKFKDGKKAKALLNRQFPDSKADIQSLLDKGVIKEQGNDYVIAALEPQQVTVTVAKTNAAEIERLNNARKAELDRPKKYANYDVLGNIEKINDFKFEGSYLKVGIRSSSTSASYSDVNLLASLDKKIIKEIEKKEGKDKAIEYIKEQLRIEEQKRVNDINSHYNKLIAALNYEVKTKAEEVADNLLALPFTKDVNGNFSLQIDTKNLSDEQISDINDATKIINEKIKNNEFDSWKVSKEGDIITITKPSLTSAQPQEQEGESNQPDEVPDLTKQQEQRKLNGHGTINDYNAILRRLFGSFENVAKGISMLSDELSQTVATPEEVSIKQEELVKEEQIKDNAVPIDVTPDKEVVYSTSTDIVDDASPKLGYSVFDFSTSQKIQTKDGRTVVKIETINEGLKKNQGKGRIKPIKTANFDKVKPGTKLTVTTGEGGALDFKFLRTLVIPQRVEDKNDPLYGTDVLKNGKTQTITFGEWVDGKLKEKGMTLEDLPEFMETQEFWDVVPIFVADSDGDYIGQIHDPGWYTKAKFNGDIEKARRNVNEVRKLIKEAYYTFK